MRKQPSLKKTLTNELRALAMRRSGSFLTKEARISSANCFVNCLIETGYVLGDVGSIKPKHVHAYVDQMRRDGRSARTIQNAVSNLRQILRMAGRGQFVDDQLSSEKLGLESGSRRGTKLPITDELYFDVFSRAQNSHPDIAAGMQLSRHLGLRAQEVVRSCESLEQWNFILLANADNAAPLGHLELIYGAKGGRPRSLPLIFLPNRFEVARAVSEALQICQSNGGRLIAGATLDSAVNRWDNSVRRLGLTGKYASHSLRYRFATDTLAFLTNGGRSLKDSLAIVSMMLGHGDGRGRWIKNVYCQNFTNSEPCDDDN